MIHSEVPKAGSQHCHYYEYWVSLYSRQQKPWGRSQRVGLCAEHRGKLVMSYQAEQNKAFWSVTSNWLVGRLKGDAAGREAGRRGCRNT